MFLPFSRIGFAFFEELSINYSAKLFTREQLFISDNTIIYILIETLTLILIVDNSKLYYLQFATGVWYQVARYPNDFEKSGDCVTFNFRNENGKYYLVLNEVTDHKRESFSALTDFAPNAGNKGILFLNFTVVKGEIFFTFPTYTVDFKLKYKFRGWQREIIIFQYYVST